MHMNLCGPLATSHGGVKYFLTFINDFSRKTFLCTIKIKFDVFDKIKGFQSFDRKLDWKENQGNQM